MALKFQSAADVVRYTAAVADSYPFSIAVKFRLPKCAAAGDGLDHILWGSFEAAASRGDYVWVRGANGILRLSTRDQFGVSSASTTAVIQDRDWQWAFGYWTSTTSRSVALNLGAFATDTVSRPFNTRTHTVIGANSTVALHSNLDHEIEQVGVWSGIGALTEEEYRDLYFGFGEIGDIRHDDLVSWVDFRDGEIVDHIDQARNWDALGNTSPADDEEKEDYQSDDDGEAGAAASGSVVPVFAHHYRQQGIL